MDSKKIHCGGERTYAAPVREKQKPPKLTIQNILALEKKVIKVRNKRQRKSIVIKVNGKVKHAVRFGRSPYARNRSTSTPVISSRDHICIENLNLLN